MLDCTTADAECRIGRRNWLYSPVYGVYSAGRPEYRHNQFIASSQGGRITAKSYNKHYEPKQVTAFIRSK